MPVSTKLQVRRDTAANWTTANATLASGEIGFETDTLKFKIGNGSTAWTSLKYSQDASLLTGNASITTLTTTGDINTAGKLSVTASAGDEGGEIFLANAVTNTSINNGVTIDVYQNRLRFFEQGGSARGYYIDITAGGGGASTNLAGGGGGSGTVTSITASSPLTGGTITTSGTIGIDASSTNTANYVVQRDSSGNFAANTVTASLTGTASLATNLVGGTTNRGEIVYQSGVNTTAELTAPTTNNVGLHYNTSTNAPFWLQPTLSNTYYAATTSAQLAGVISDETGTGNLVFNTSPTIVTPSITTSITTTTSSTFSLINTTAATINFGGAATVMNIGSTVPGSYIDVGYDFIVSNNLTVDGSSTLTSATFGGGYGNTGTTISTAGNIETNGTLVVDGNFTAGSISLNASIIRAYLAGGGTTGATFSNTGALIRTTSSARYKQDITDAVYSYEDILSLSPKTFRLKDEAETDPESKIYGGLIAEDVDQIESLRVFVNYQTQEDGSKIPDGIAYGEMVSALVSALKHQNLIIENLTSRIEALENN
jgi:hypothetical protein